MDSRELAELQRLLKKASDADLMDGGKIQSTSTQGGGKTQSISSAGAGTGAMTDASKRRLIDEGWAKVDPEPEVQQPTEDDLKLKSIWKRTLRMFGPKSTLTWMIRWLCQKNSEMSISGAEFALIWTSMQISEFVLRRLWQWRSQVILT